MLHVSSFLTFLVFCWVVPKVWVDFSVQYSPVKERVCCLCLGLSWIKLLYTFVGRFKKKKICLFLAVLGLCWGLVSSCGAYVSCCGSFSCLEHGLQAMQASGAGRVRSVAVASGLSSCSSWAREQRLNSYLESSWIRDWIRVSCIGRQILYHWATREVLWAGFCANESFHFSGLNAQECNFWVVCLIF